MFDPPVLIPLALGILALLVVAVLKAPDFFSWRRARGREVFTPLELEQVLHGAPPAVVDLRAPELFNGPLGHIRGAHNIPLGQLVRALATASPDKRQLVVLVDADDRVSHRAAAILAADGYTWVRVLRGGMRAWRARDLPVSISGRRA